jgi:hypothetical protein
MLDAMNLGTLFAALYVSHHIADHWIQTSGQACGKGNPGWHGRRACAGHVAGHMLVSIACLASLNIIGIHLTVPVMATGLGIIAVTHYWIDRRAPLYRLAALFGKTGFITACTVVRKPGDIPAETGPGTGLYALDQSFHFLWLFISALVMIAIG